MDSPPPKVCYGELPEQPFQVFYAQTSFATSQDVLTPRRKKRIARSGRTRKRPRSESTDHSSRRPECTQDILPAVGENSILNNDFGAIDIDFGGVFAGSDEAEPPSPKAELTYAGFVAAVLSDECSFYQLSQKVFVANGWDAVRNEANVCVAPLQHVRVDQNFLSLHGITCKGLQSRMTWVLLVFVLWANLMLIAFISASFVITEIGDSPLMRECLVGLKL